MKPSDPDTGIPAPGVIVTVVAAFEGRLPVPPLHDNSGTADTPCAGDDHE